jgi:hypothetical protein
MSQVRLHQIRSGVAADVSQSDEPPAPGPLRVLVGFPTAVPALTQGFPVRAEGDCLEEGRRSAIPAWCGSTARP